MHITTPHFETNTPRGAQVDVNTCYLYNVGIKMTTVLARLKQKQVTRFMCLPFPLGHEAVIKQHSFCYVIM